MPPRGKASGSAPKKPSGRGGAPGASSGSVSIGSSSTGPAAHIKTIGVRRPGYGKAGKQVEVLVNAYPVTLPQEIIHHYDVIEPASPSKRINVLLIRQLQEVAAPNTFTPRAVYDGEKNMFAARDLDIGNGQFEVTLSAGSPTRPPKIHKIKLTKVQEINPEVLQRFVEGKQSHENAALTAITALNIVIRMAPLDLAAKGGGKDVYTFDARSIYINRETRQIGGGIELWRGYFQSIRPVPGQMIVNVDIATGTMYKPGPLIGLLLDFLGQPGGNPVTMLSAKGMRDHVRLAMSRFVSGLKFTTAHTQKAGDKGPARLREAKKLSRDGADQISFVNKEGKKMTVAQYFKSINLPLKYPGLICVEERRGAMIPLELCAVPQGQIMRKEVPDGLKKAVLDFATKKPAERLASIQNGLPVLQYVESDYINQFGMQVQTQHGPLKVQGRVLNTPALLYGRKSKIPKVVPRDGSWNMVDKQFYNPSTIRRWVIVIYAPQHRFTDQNVQNTVAGLVAAGRKVGMNFLETNPLYNWENGQAKIEDQLRRAGKACFDKAKGQGGPDLIVAVLPDSVQDIYNAIKHFGDIKQGVATQCLRASKCFRANEQYFMNVLLKINVKLGGMNLIPEPASVSMLNSQPTLIIGADVMHPAPGTDGIPSFTAMVGNVDSNAVKYISTMKVQTSRQEIIDDAKEMVKHLITEWQSYQINMEKKGAGVAPKRIVFYRDGVSEGQFQHVLDLELPLIQAACQEMNIDAKITLIIVGKRHHIRFIPVNANPNDDARRGNCGAGTVIDRGIGHPTEFDYYLLSHGALLGTSRPSHYSVLYDENGFDADSIQALSFALCHVYARATRSVSIPAPVYYADIVCARAKIHFEPGSSLEMSETGTLDSGRIQTTLQQNKAAFKPLHPTQSRLMYFS